MTESAADVGGTLAHLNPLEWVSVYDLLYGLMLPSGNDAANVLAENMGAILYFRDCGNEDAILGTFGNSLERNQKHRSDLGRSEH